MALSDALASLCKTLHVNAGRQVAVPTFDVESVEHLFLRHLVVA